MVQVYYIILAHQFIFHSTAAPIIFFPSLALDKNNVMIRDRYTRLIHSTNRLVSIIKVVNSTTTSPY